MNTRRQFLCRAIGSAAVLHGMRPESLAVESDQESPQQLKLNLDQVLRQPILRLERLRQPVIVESIDLLKSDNSYLLRTRSQSGLEVVTVPHQSKISILYPILLQKVIPAFIGRDARELESLLWQVYRHASNYKMQGLALWVCVAAVEMALLELLSHAAEVPLADLFGGVKKRDIAVYYASGNRGNAPEEEIEHLQRLISDSGVKALKFRLGGRMSRNADSRPGRSEALIELARQEFGDQMVLYADSNSSYDREEAIRIGRMMQRNGYGFFEEPCEFDDMWGTKAIADELEIPIAGGEQEYSMHRWMWTIANRGVDIVQPDLHYGGGMIRAAKVAAMARHAGMSVVPHMSGGGLGYVEVVHFASFVPNVGPYMEFKGNAQIPVRCETSSLKVVDGMVRCPSGIGFGVTVDPEFVQRGKVVDS